MSVEVVTLIVVPTRLDSLVSLHRHTVDHNNISTRARNTNRSRGSTDTRRNLKEVVVGACSDLPRFAVRRDFHLRRAAVGVDDLGREPVRRDAGLRVDGKGAGDLGALDEFIGGIDDAFGGAVEGGESVREEVEVAFIALRALVDDLVNGLVEMFQISRRGKESYHSSNRLATVRDLHTATTIGSLVPSLATESSAVEAGRQSVGRERASTA